MTRTKKSGERAHRSKDPFAEREANQYDEPIPSREFILEGLGAASSPQSFEDIAATLELSSDINLDALRRRLRAMCRDGQLMLNRKGRFALPSRLEMQRCRVIGHRDGYGFAKPEEGDDFFLTARQMQQVFDGDTVLVATVGRDQRNRPQGKIVEILERAHTDIVGRYIEEGGIGYVQPHNTRITQTILIPPNKKGPARNGQVVSARITHYPTDVLGAKADITEILGDHLDPGLEIDVAIRAHGIPYEWSDHVLEEAGALGDEPAEEDKGKRVDLRGKAFVTIDGEDAKDFDDAVYCETDAQGYRLWVAIADVSHYVPIHSALDQEAAMRGNSVYFPGRVVPMFPEVLSNGLCSLKPRVDRLAMVCEMVINHDGELVDSAFYESVIHSHARLTYTQVGAVLEEGWHPDVEAERLPDLLRLQALYRVLRGARDRRGAIDFETVETRIEFDSQRKIEAIVPVVRNDAHKLIEECMLIANVATAQFLSAAKLPILYRVHEGPSTERLENLRTFLGELALELGGGERPTPTDYQVLLAQLTEREDAKIIQTMMLRSLSQAVYQPDNLGHFGLHYEAYAHFTSPIRRYPDLLVHRAIRHLIRSRKKVAGVRRIRGAGVLSKDQIYPYDLAIMAAFGEQCSMTERRADEATREVEAWLKCEYLRDKIGESYRGVIAAVTSFGLFVELHDLYIEGLVHISALPGDYYHFDHANQRLVGEHSRQVFQIGGVVNVQVVRVDLDERKIDLELTDSAGNINAKSGAPGAKGEGKKRRSRASSKGAEKPGKKEKAERSPPADGGKPSAEKKRKPRRRGAKKSS